MYLVVIWPTEISSKINFVDLQYDKEKYGLKIIRKMNNSKRMGLFSENQLKDKKKTVLSYTRRKNLPP